MVCGFIPLGNVIWVSQNFFNFIFPPKHSQWWTYFISYSSYIFQNTLTKSPFLQLFYTHSLFVFFLRGLLHHPLGNQPKNGEKVLSIHLISLQPKAEGSSIEAGTWRRWGEEFRREPNGDVWATSLNCVPTADWWSLHSNHLTNSIRASSIV